MSKKITELRKPKKMKGGISLEAFVNRSFNTFLKQRKASMNVSIEVAEEEWREDLERKAAIVRLNNKSDDVYAVILRGETGNIYENLDIPFKTYEEALEKYESCLEIVKASHLNEVLAHYPTAKRLVAKIHKEGGKGDYSSYQNMYNLPFLLAASELYEKGFETKNSEGKLTQTIEGIVKTTNAQFWQERIQENHYLAKFLKDIVVSKDNKRLKEDLIYGFSLLLKKSTLTESTFRGYFFRIHYAIFSVLYEHNPDVFVKLEGVSATFLAAFKTITNKEMYHYKDNPHGRIKPSKSHPMIPVKELRELLNLAFDHSLPVFNHIILSLSTAMRPIEVRRLINDPDRFLIDGGYLDYKSGFLVTKTSKKVAIKTLPNPSLSIISRVLLKYKHPLKSTEEKAVKKFFTQIKEKDSLKKFYERCLRTTAGHMIAYCLKAHDKYQATVHDVKTRMCHKDIEMATTVYAVHLPHESMLPHDYFECTGIHKMVEDEVLPITEYQPLWDAFLLQFWIEKMADLYSDQPKNMEIVWNQIISEAKEFRKGFNTSKDALKPKVY